VGKCEFMKTMAAILILAGAAAAQETKVQVQLTDSQAGDLGAFVTDKVDANASGLDLDRAIRDKVDALQKGTAAEKKEDPAPAKEKKKKKKGGKKGGKKASKKGSPPTPAETIKNGLNDLDRITLGKFAVTEINADHPGQVLADAVVKELARLREERSKAPPAGDSTPATKKTEEANP
jgi:hypothetical protein